MMSHLALCRRNTGLGWAIVGKNSAGGGWSVLSVTAADGVDFAQAEVLGLLRQHPEADLSFSTRSAIDFTDQPGDALGNDAIGTLKNILPGTSVTIFCREGVPYDPECFASLWRSQTGALISGGLTTRFMRVSLPDQVKAWFEFDGHKKLARPVELWVRHGSQWYARTLLPDAFPSLPTGPRGPAPEVAKDREAKFKKVAAHDAMVASTKRQSEGREAHAKADAEWRRKRLAQGSAG